MESVYYVVGILVISIIGIFLIISLYYLIKSYQIDIKLSNSKIKYYELKIKRLMERMK